MRNYQFDGTLQEETSGATVSFSFAKNITAEAGVTRDMERYPIDRFLEDAVLGGGHHCHQPAADGYGHDERAATRSAL